MRDEKPRVTDDDANDLEAARVVVVAAHECHRSDAAQLIEHVVAADVAGVDDLIDAGEYLGNARMKDAMCIGNDSYAAQIDAFLAQVLSL